MLTLAPFGFRAAYHPNGLIRARAYKVVDTAQAAYGTAIYQGAPVIFETTGMVNVAAAGANWLGIMQGVSYIAADGKPTQANYLPATPTGITNVVFYIIDDPDTVFEVQSEATIAGTAIGDQFTTFSATYTAASGTASTGRSTCALTGTLAGAGAQGMATILGFSNDPKNAVGDSYPIVQVQIARPQFRPLIVAV